MNQALAVLELSTGTPTRSSLRRCHFGLSVALWVASLVALLAGCSDKPAPAPTPVADALFSSATLFATAPLDRAAFDAELDRITARAAKHAARPDGAARAAALAQLLFDELGFEREVKDTDLRFVLLPKVLESRRGSCVGLGTLVLALGERLHWPVEAVMVPGHFYVRLLDSRGHTNLELLRRGERMPDAWYEQRFPIPGGHAPEYGRALTLEEVQAIIAYDAGNELRRADRFREAGRAYDRATRAFPDFAEAHASLGAIAQLQGQLDEARTHYEAARRAFPLLPGVSENIGLLEAELGSAPTGAMHDEQR